MTTEDHYAEAQQLNSRAHHFIWGDGADTAVGHAFAAMAQVHATLALVDAVHAVHAPPVALDIVAEPLQRCPCLNLLELGNGVCRTCGHLADLHGPHHGPCAVEIEPGS